MGRRILALDQSSRTTGYSIYTDGALETFGHFTYTDDDIGERLMKIRQKVDSLINKYDITELVLEDIQLQANVGDNVATFKKLAEVFGVLYELGTEKDLKVSAVLAVQWKNGLKFKTKHREDQKREAQALVNTTFQVKATQDEADAICIGLYHLLKTNKIPETEDYDWS